MDVKVLLSELVAKGISQNTEFLNRKIDGLASRSQRMETQVTDLSPLMNSLVDSLQIQAEIIFSTILNRLQAANILAADTQSGTLKYGKILDSNQAVSNNLSLSSLELMMRQEQYLINETTVYWIRILLICFSSF